MGQCAWSSALTHRRRLSRLVDCGVAAAKCPFFAEIPPAMEGWDGRYGRERAGGDVRFARPLTSGSPCATSIAPENSAFPSASIALPRARLRAVSVVY